MRYPPISEIYGILTATRKANLHNLKINFNSWDVYGKYILCNVIHINLFFQQLVASWILIQTFNINNIQKFILLNNQDILLYDIAQFKLNTKHHMKQRLITLLEKFKWNNLHQTDENKIIHCSADSASGRTAWHIKILRFFLFTAIS